MVNCHGSDFLINLAKQTYFDTPMSLHRAHNAFAKKACNSQCS